MSIEVVVKNKTSIVKWRLDAEYEAHLKQLLDKWGINTDCKLKRKE